MQVRVPGLFGQVTSAPSTHACVTAVNRANGSSPCVPGCGFGIAAMATLSADSTAGCAESATVRAADGPASTRTADSPSASSAAAPKQTGRVMFPAQKAGSKASTSVTARPLAVRHDRDLRSAQLHILECSQDRPDGRVHHGGVECVAGVQHPVPDSGSRQRAGGSFQPGQADAEHRLGRAVHRGHTHVGAQQRFEVSGSRSRGDHPSGRLVSHRAGTGYDDAGACAERHDLGEARRR